MLFNTSEFGHFDSSCHVLDPHHLNVPDLQFSRFWGLLVGRYPQDHPTDLSKVLQLRPQSFPPSRHTDLHQHLNSQCDLRKEARGKSPAKERLRRRLGQNDRESSRPSSSAHTDVWAETPSPLEEVPHSAYRSSSVRVGREKHKRSDRSISEHRDRDVLPPSVPKKKARRGEQRAVWKDIGSNYFHPVWEKLRSDGSISLSEEQSDLGVKWSDIQNAAHLRQSFGISNSAHLVPTSYSETPGSSVHQVISFSDDDLRDVQLPHSDPLVITLKIGNYDVKRVLIDQGSFVEVMYQGLYEKLGLGESDLANFTSPLFGFSGESTTPLGKTTLPVLAGLINLQTEFIVIQASSPYNAIMGRDWLHRMKAVSSTLHQKLRFPTKDGIMEVNGDQVVAKQCVLTAIGQKAPKGMNST
uniref:Uncharacterized protein n=1 Tax=Fagus sylvatica TaxID=28930 RepID=A0A2N9IBW7_FAGSY